MKRGRSTGKPTKAEAARIVAAKEGPCIPCLSWAISGQMDIAEVVVGGDYDHKKSGNIRRGHMQGFCSCGWHHRRLPLGLCGSNWMASFFGPSIMDGSKAFRAAYGTDDELIQLQTMVIELGQDEAVKQWQRS